MQYYLFNMRILFPLSSCCPMLKCISFNRVPFRTYIVSLSIPYGELQLAPISKQSSRFKEEGPCPPIPTLQNGRKVILWHSIARSSFWYKSSNQLELIVGIDFVNFSFPAICLIPYELGPNCLVLKSPSAHACACTRVIESKL